MQTITFRI